MLCPGCGFQGIFNPIDGYVTECPACKNQYTDDDIVDFLQDIQNGVIVCEYEIEDNIPVIYIFGRDREGKRTLHKDREFHPYFYISESCKNILQDDERIIRIEKSKCPTLFGTYPYKVICKSPKDFRDLKKDVVHYEADILYTNRYMIDNCTEIRNSPLSTVFLDIETDSSDDFPSSITTPDAITAITCLNDLKKICVTFVWREDQEQKVEKNGKKQIELLSKKIFEYDDYTMYFNNEKDMLNKFLKFVKDIDPDIFTAWNTDFDMPYIINRMHSLELDFEGLSPMKKAFVNDRGKPFIKGRIIFDALEATRKLSYGELDSYKLELVAQELLGEGKIKFEGNFSELWKKQLPLHIEYNKKDVLLVFRINNNKQLIKQFDNSRRLSKCAFNDVIDNSKVIDSYGLSFAKGEYVLPSKGGHEKVPFDGGKVLKTKKGIHEYVIVLDFKRLYPSIICGLHASPETIIPIAADNTINVSIPYVNYDAFMKTNKDGELEIDKNRYKKAKDIFDAFFEDNWDIKNQRFSKSLPAEISKNVKYMDAHFNRNVEGLIPRMLNHANNKRSEIQVERDTFEYGSPEYEQKEFEQFGFKRVVNSFYGVLGYFRSRFYTIEIASSTTFIGRNILLWSKQLIEKYGYLVVYGDTDSLMITTKARINNEDMTPIIKDANKIVKILQDSYDEFAAIFNMKEHFFELEFEKVFKKILFGDAKKRYAGIPCWYKGKIPKERKIKITGFEVVRSDWSKTARTVQKNIFNMMLIEDKTQDEILDYLKSIKKKIKAGELDCENIGIPTPLKKSLSKYKSLTPMVRAVSYSNSKLKMKIKPGEKFFLIYVKNARTDVIAVRGNSDFPKGMMIDYEKHIEEATQNNMERVFDALGWDISMVDGQKSALDY